MSGCVTIPTINSFWALNVSYSYIFVLLVLPFFKNSKFTILLTFDVTLFTQLKNVIKNKK